MPDVLQLSTTFQLTKEHVKLVYEAHNPARRDAYLLNRLYLTVPAWKMTPDVIYVHVLPKTKTIWLSKMLAEIPQGVMPNSLVAPYVTPLRAGAKFKEEVKIPLPVGEYRQYGGEIHAAAEESPLDVYKEVYFSLGYYWRPADTREEETEVQGTPVIMPRTPPGKPLEFGLAQSDRQRLDIPVRLLGGKPPPAGVQVKP